MKANLKEIKAFVCSGDLGVIKVFEADLLEEIAYLKSMEPEELYSYIHGKEFEKEVLGE